MAVSIYPSSMPNVPWVPELLTSLYFHAQSTCSVTTYQPFFSPVTVTLPVPPPLV